MKKLNAMLPLLAGILMSESNKDDGYLKLTATPEFPDLQIKDSMPSVGGYYTKPTLTSRQWRKKKAKTRMQKESRKANR
jgi:hypothetical protein